MSPTIYDVAKMAGVSISTVSRVLNNSAYASEETRKKVLEAVEKLNFQKNMIASALMNKQTSTFGLVIPDITNIFYAHLTRAVEDVANRHGMNVILCNTDYDLKKEEMYIRFLLQKGIDGIIFSTPEVHNQNIKTLVKSHPQLPVIVVGSRVEGVQVEEVLVDNMEGALLATRHLLELGHRHIGFISGNPKSLATLERRKGFEMALEEKGVSLRPEWIRIDEFKIESGYRNAKEILQKNPRPTAFFAGNDSIAVGIYRAAKELNLSIPQDLSVVGFDDSQYAEILDPMLTTVRSPIREMGKRAMELAIEGMKEKKSSKETVVFRSTLVQRESVRSLSECPADRNPEVSFSTKGG